MSTRSRIACLFALAALVAAATCASACSLAIDFGGLDDGPPDAQGDADAREGGAG